MPLSCMQCSHPRMRHPPSRQTVLVLVALLDAERGWRSSCTPSADTWAPGGSCDRSRWHDQVSQNRLLGQLAVVSPPLHALMHSSQQTGSRMPLLPPLVPPPAPKLLPCAAAPSCQRSRLTTRQPGGKPPATHGTSAHAAGTRATAPGVVPAPSLLLLLAPPLLLLLLLLPASSHSTSASVQPSSHAMAQLTRRPAAGTGSRTRNSCSGGEGLPPGREVLPPPLACSSRRQEGP